ncbi:MAG TPA: RNA 2',3'-cyclic phosphodiesterase [Rubricoccaceae bacterium]|nr:RNA 2',3'-cyclic phosphodiesterase [Rubricoccaceae bacterium]
MPRLFVALRPPPDVVEALLALRGEVPSARWLPADHLHLTLKFLGEVSDAEAVAAALASVGGKPVEVRLDRLGAFPSPARARVLVAHGPLGAELGALLAHVEEALAMFAPAEARPFRPHVTLARLKTVEAPAIRRWQQTPAPDLRFVADEVVLYESRLHPKGAVYAVRAAYPLSSL